MLIAVEKLIDLIAEVRAKPPEETMAFGFKDGSEYELDTLYVHRKVARQEAVVDFFDHKAKRLTLRTWAGIRDGSPPSVSDMANTYLRLDDAKKVLAEDLGENSPAFNEALRRAIEGGLAEFGEEAGCAEPIAPVDENSVIRRKRNALVKELVSIWPSIEQDLSDASRKSSGLSLAAKLGQTFWDLTKAICWAVERGKITKTKAEQSLATHPDSVFAATLRQLFKI